MDGKVLLVHMSGETYHAAFQIAQQTLNVLTSSVVRSLKLLTFEMEQTHDELQSLYPGSPQFEEIYRLESMSLVEKEEVKKSCNYIDSFEWLKMFDLPAAFKNQIERVYGYAVAEEMHDLPRVSKKFSGEFSKEMEKTETHFEKSVNLAYVDFLAEWGTLDQIQGNRVLKLSSLDRINQIKQLCNILKYAMRQMEIMYSSILGTVARITGMDGDLEHVLGLLPEHAYEKPHVHEYNGRNGLAEQQERELERQRALLLLKQAREKYGPPQPWLTNGSQGAKEKNRVRDNAPMLQQHAQFTLTQKVCLRCNLPVCSYISKIH
jgi:hypothetical protein